MSIVSGCKRGLQHPALLPFKAVVVSPARKQCPCTHTQTLWSSIIGHVRVYTFIALQVALSKSWGKGVPVAALPGCVDPGCPISQDVSLP